MREILFRGKRIDSGEWVYGTMYKIAKDLNPFILTGGKRGCSYQVEEETVGQYTGLKDKNGKRIFEGDIMSFAAYGFDYVGSVDIVDGNASVMCKHASPFLDQAVSKHGAYIIGNVHDNPELLEK